MILNALDTRRVLGRYPISAAFLLGLHEAPKMHDPVLNDDIDCQQTCPRLRLKLRVKSLMNSAIIRADRFRNIGRRQSS